MTQVPDADAVRAMLRPLDERDRKVAGGLVALMIAEPRQLRDPEWLARSFLHVAVVAFGFDPDDGTAGTEDVEMVQRYAQGHMRPICNAAMALFLRVAEDLRASGGSPSFDDARALVAGYLAP